jgi:hypothetical protein
MLMLCSYAKLWATKSMRVVGNNGSRIAENEHAMGHGSHDDEKLGQKILE